MAQITSKQIRGIFYTIEINLILWIVVVTSIWQSSAESFTKQAATAGFILAALL